MTISIAGTGYVGMSLAVLLSQQNKAVAEDIVPEWIASWHKLSIPNAKIEKNQ